ncbi:hypothetical protein D9K81_01295 [Acinetobacter chengduensis]|uniref:Lipoprotein n=1 Tax=Acinetobacter chengduensis TaxID=2420890 RepID=A0ABX9U0A1_9GAMM|nr:hypothetical protein D7V31_08200 [Acinetobacter sp. WCHAc060007]RLL24643.1 hypothetical protein D9K81_01295 [Acinetobacter chengduensis]
MKAKLMCVIMAIFILTSLGCLIIGIHNSDLIFVFIGLLMGTASSLMYFEVKKEYSNPFNKD